MSSTNRSNARDSHISDYYVTPQKPILDVLEYLFNNCNNKKLEGFDDCKYGSWLDPCSGGDENNDMSYPKALSKYGITPTTFDIRQDSKADFKCDYLNTEVYDGKFDVIITNPPFNIAKEIIEKSINDIKTGGFVIMLLRLNFFGSKKRKSFWENNMPILTFVHRDRISFTNGQTDSIEYMHCVWKKGVNQDFTKLLII
jgi:hypothetical protein